LKIICTKEERSELLHIISTHEKCPDFCKGWSKDSCDCTEDLFNSIEWEITDEDNLHT